MKALKKNELAGGLVALLAVAVLGLFSLTGCASAPKMTNAVDIAPSSEQDPFVSTIWGDLNTPQIFKFNKDGTVMFGYSGPYKYTVTSGDEGIAASFKVAGGQQVHTLTISTPDATEGVILQKIMWMSSTIPVTKN